MTLIRKLVSVVCLALSLTSYSASTNAQQIVDAGTTGNLINFGTSPTATTSTWQNVGQMGGSLQCWAPGQPGYCGPRPYVNANGQGMINFSYGQTDLYQNINIAAAINQTSADTTGLYVTGFNFGFRAKNGNGWDGGRQDYLGAYVSFTNSSGTPVATYNYTNQTNRQYNWTDFSFRETFANPAQISALQTARVGFVGRDLNGWAGPYGPEVSNVNFALRYGYNPCVQNPAYSVDCPGFKNVVESTNLVPNPTAYAVFGNSVNNSFAINQAFSAAGTGMQIHGFRWGYVANANGPYCADSFLFWCLDNRDPYVRTNVNITNNTGGVLYNMTREYRYSYNTTDYKYLFPSSQQLGNLGNFNFTAQTNDQAYIGSMWARAIYTPDQCMLNPLSNPNCPGYAKAIATQTTTSTTTDTSTSTTPTASVATTSISTSPSVAPTSSTTPTSVDTVQPVTTTSSSSSSTSSNPSSSSATTASTSATPTINNPQPKIGEVTTAGSQSNSSKSSSSVSISQILNTVRAEQSRIGALETSTAMAAVEQSQQAGTKTANDAQSIAVNQQMQSASNAQTVATTIMSSTQSSTQSNLSSQSSGSGLSLLSIQSNGFSVSTFRSPDLYSLTTNQTTGPALLTTINSNQNYNNRSGREELRTFEQNSSFEQRQSLSSTNPLTTVMNPPPMLAPPPPAPTGPSVNKDVKDNDAAGGLSIASIAKQPQGFELYMSGLQDRPFYTPKEIYRGQKVVDNARAQRMLSGASDRLHEEMVNQQYKNLEGK